MDYLVVGSGLTGAVIARSLHDAGREVLVVERRDHAGGNVHDRVHPDSGIRVHSYGPHYFATASPRIWEFATRFAPFHRYEPAVLSSVDGALERWPVTGSYIQRHHGPGWTPAFRGVPANFEEAALSMMPRAVYERFVKEYTEKQWGVPATTLAAELCARFDVRADDEPRLKPAARFQGLPRPGYAAWMAAMLDGVPLRLGWDHLERREALCARRALVFTGPIDELYGYALGRLHYRGQRRIHDYLPDVDWAQPCGQVNNPQHAGGPHIRTLEWKHMLPPEEAARTRGTVLTREIPCTPDSPGDCEYPFPDALNQALYRRYRERARAEPGLLVCGRLGEYRYLDMDQAIGRALSWSRRLLGPEKRRGARWP